MGNEIWIKQLEKMKMKKSAKVFVAVSSECPEELGGIKFCFESIKSNKFRQFFNNTRSNIYWDK